MLKKIKITLTSLLLLATFQLSANPIQYSDLKKLSNNYSNSFGKMMEEPEFLLLKSVKKSRLKPLLDELSKTSLNSKEKRGEFALFVKHFYGNKIAKKVIAHYQKIGIDFEKQTTSKPNISLLSKDELKKLHSIVLEISDMQIDLLSNPVYLAYRDDKIAIKSLVLKNKEEVKKEIEKETVKEDFLKKGYSKIFYWIAKK